jgi:hypothetical protein
MSSCQAEVLSSNYLPLACLSFEELLITRHGSFFLALLTFLVYPRSYSLAPQGARLIIYTESDYLEAHLTEIAADARSWPLSIETVPERLASVLEKFTAADSDSPSSPTPRASNSRNRPR